jgi:hypothetical protein
MNEIISYMLIITGMFLCFRFLPRNSRLFPTYFLEYLWAVVLYIIIGAGMCQVPVMLLPIYLVVCGCAIVIVYGTLISILVHIYG